MDSAFNYMTTEKGLKIRTGFWASAQPSSRHIVLLPGRASFMETFNTTIKTLQQRCFNVWSLDWRGQGLSSRLLAQHAKGHINNYEEYLQDLNQFMTTVVKPQAGHIYFMLAQSMGAHVGLRYLQNHDTAFAAALFVSPMFDILTGAYPRSFVNKLVKVAHFLKCDDAYAWTQGDFDADKEPFQDNFMSSDAQRYQAHLDLQKDNPTRTIGGVTYGWLRATFESTKILLDPTWLRKVRLPILILQSGQDRVVNNDKVAVVMSSLPQASLKVYPTARHQVFLESDEIQTAFWSDCDEFMNKYAPQWIQQRQSSQPSSVTPTYFPVLFQRSFSKPLF